MPGKRERLSAQVVLKPAAREAPGGDDRVTSGNVHAFLPSQEAIELAREALAAAGFEVGDVVANSFSITGAVGTFEKALKTRLRRDAHGALPMEALPTTALPKPAREVIDSIVFSSPPDFGPRSY